VKLYLAFGLQGRLLRSEVVSPTNHSRSARERLDHAHNERRNRRSPSETGHATESLTIFVEDVELHFVRAKEADAEIMKEPHETVRVEFQYAAEDLEGHS
jgi:uncharacterized glyoxalase superfamily protein PhnB